MMYMDVGWLFSIREALTLKSGQQTQKSFQTAVKE